MCVCSEKKDDKVKLKENICWKNFKGKKVFLLCVFKIFPIFVHEKKKASKQGEEKKNLEIENKIAKEEEKKK